MADTKLCLKKKFGVQELLVRRHNYNFILAYSKYAALNSGVEELFVERCLWKSNHEEVPTHGALPKTRPYAQKESFSCWITIPTWQKKKTGIWGDGWIVCPKP